MGPARLTCPQLTSVRLRLNWTTLRSERPRGVVNQSPPREREDSEEPEPSACDSSLTLELRAAP